MIRCATGQRSHMGPVDAGGPYTVAAGAIVRLSAMAAPPEARPWVELYGETGFKDPSIVVDHDDRGLLELQDSRQPDRFGDKASSVRWYAPNGMTVILHQDKGYSGRAVVLRGTGRSESISNLDDQVVLSGSLSTRTLRRSLDRRSTSETKGRPYALWESSRPLRNWSGTWMTTGSAEKPGPRLLGATRRAPHPLSTPVG